MRESVTVTVSNHGRRHLASTDSPWEHKAGTSRAVRIGNTIAVTGTVGIEPDGSFPPTVAAQMHRAMAIVLASIEALGGSAYDIIRTRIYVTDIESWESIASVHAEALGGVRPATTFVEVSRLIHPAALVLIEADAVLGSGRG